MYEGILSPYILRYICQDFEGTIEKGGVLTQL
jgi:hypothetical protein